MGSNITVSFEFFPARSPEAQSRLRDTARQLKPFSPAFLTVTYGAGGSTYDGTFDTVVDLYRDSGIDTASHLTFVATPAWKLATFARKLKQAGVGRVIALRGDAPKGRAPDLYGGPGFFRSTPAFISFLKQTGDFEISVAAYPEKHPDAPSLEADLDMLAHKCGAGADRAITQFFFNNDDYYRFLDLAQKRGITAPIVPGILPILDFEKMTSFAARCRASVPQSLADRFEGADSADHLKVAAEVICEQVRDLAENGVEHFHIFTLNQAGMTIKACEALGLNGAGDQGSAAA
ncbi:MAG: methylenetetrahydrofolate reductase [Hyphomicrobiaceae bacterium]